MVLPVPDAPIIAILYTPSSFIMGGSGSSCGVTSGSTASLLRGIRLVIPSPFISPSPDNTLNFSRFMSF